VHAHTPLAWLVVTTGAVPASSTKAPSPRADTGGKA
jgi:hypothetical protein